MIFLGIENIQNLWVSPQKNIRIEENGFWVGQLIDVVLCGSDAVYRDKEVAVIFVNNLNTKGR